MNNNWIDINDRLPEIGDCAIGYDEYYGRVGEIKRESYRPYRLVFLDTDDCHIVYWQPLPDIPMVLIND